MAASASTEPRHDPAVAAYAKLLAAEQDPNARRRLLATAKTLAMNSLSDEEIEQGLKFAHPAAASEIEPESIDWLWRDYLPLGCLSLLYGPEGDGKSVLTVMLAAMVTRGTLPGELRGEPANVEIFAYEDDAAAVLVPRLIAAGADLERVFIQRGDLGSDLLTLPDDVEQLAAELRAREAKLVIVDPLPDAMREGLKDNNNGDVRKAIVPLHNAAQDVGASILGVTHPNKGATDAANKVMGSKAWRSVPRSVLIYGRDPDDLDGETRIVAVSKTNYARKQASKVRMTSVDVDVAGAQPRAEIVGTSKYSDNDVLLANVGAQRPEGRETKQRQAERLIYRLLEDGGGEVAASVAYTAGENAGIPEATMRRARGAVGTTAGALWRLDDGALPVG